MTMSETGTDPVSFRESLTAAIADMLYISESEAGVELLPPDPALTSQEDVRAAIDGLSGELSGREFLQQLRASTDPCDAALQAYADQWTQLFRLLESADEDVRVYRSGSGPVEIRIAAIVDGQAVVLKTTAVET